MFGSLVYFMKDYSVQFFAMLPGILDIDKFITVSKELKYYIRMLLDDEFWNAIGLGSHESGI